MTKGLMVVLSGPSGAGKDTILHTLLQRDPRVKLSISATTRKPREGDAGKADPGLDGRRKRRNPGDRGAGWSAG